MGTFFRWDQNNNLLLELQIHAKASKEAIIGEHNGRLKISVTTAPEGGKANKNLIKFLADYFGVPQKSIKILKGDRSKLKSVMILQPTKNWDKLKG